jgi:putative peptide zinc metalloprotease protein
MGLYLVFPAFFTDVTDGYRLTRAARVRTDLGGVYFHLLFASALIAGTAVTGNQLLLFAALLINIEIGRQFIPFVRLDGYWLLTDLTGVPDFLSQMGPFLRSILPGRQKIRTRGACPI